MKYRIGILVVLALLVGGFWFLQSNNNKPLDFESLKALGLLQLDEHARVDFTELTDQDGNKFSKENLQEKWTFAFFGFTNCPDICPVTMSILGSAERALSKAVSGEAYQRFQGMFVSVDPARDSPPEVKKFVEYFSPNFIGITGTETSIQRLAKQVNIGYRKILSGSKLNYIVEHPQYIVIFNPEGNCYGYIKPRTKKFDTNQLVQLFKELNRSRS